MNLSKLVSNLKAFSLYALAFLIGILWLVFSSRKAGKKSQELKQKAEAMKHMEQANDVDKDVDGMSDSDKRDWLRKHK